MSLISRVLTAIAGLILIISVYQPIWKIDLTAPQYPEGLYMNIWADKLGGDVEVINGLNHYIGMKTLHADEFIEFTVLPYIIWALALLGLATAVLNRRKFLYLYFGLFVLFAITAMIDFYRWEYNYGHNLDPTAPIQVPGMAYQPPLIGYKQLLNFSAYSIPDTGGWIFIGSGALLMITLLIERIGARKASKTKLTGLATAGIFAAAAFIQTGCSAGPEAIRFGKDGCDHCKMTIMDRKSGGELVTEKGKVFRFDDIRCITDFMRAQSNTTGTVYLLDYSGNGKMIPATAAFLLKSESLHTPMGGNIAAFETEAARQKIQNEVQGTPVKWDELIRR